MTDAITDLLTRTERRRVEASARLGAQQDSLGQFFTPRLAAELMASMPTLPQTGELTIIDPGAGSGSLSAALVARIIHETKVSSIHVIAHEIDPDVVPALKATLTDVVAVAASCGRSITHEVREGDYILDGNRLGDAADIVIMNPPYGKIAAQSTHRRAMEMRGVNAPNLYAAFLALGVDALKPGGQIVAITPRSYTNGAYFTQVRGWVLDRLSIDRIHVFESRKTVFADTGVLQENIILTGTREHEQGPVVISASTGHEDEVVRRTVSASDVLHAEDKHRFIRIPSEETAASATDLLRNLPATLADLGVQVSTGRVVDFRSREQLSDDAAGDAYPMIYPANMKGGVPVHPLVGGKPQWFHPITESDWRMLVPPGTYVIIKRFSAKEERRRVVAGIWSDDERAAAFDNKTNFLHVKGQGLDRDLAVGLSLWLNSTVLDTAFRVFSGHTQVNATDLRSMRFPDSATLRRLGEGKPFVLPDQETIDALVTGALGLALAA